MTQSKELLLDAIGSLTDEQCNAVYDAVTLAKETSTTDCRKLALSFWVARVLMRTSLETVRRYARTAEITAGIEQN